MHINEVNLFDGYNKGILNDSVLKNEPSELSKTITTFVDGEFFNHSDPLKEIFSYFVPNSNDTFNMKYIKYYTGLENVNLVSKVFYKNANEVKKEWVQKELVSLKKMYEFTTADQLVEFIIKDNLTRLNLQHFLDFNGTHLQKLIANQMILTLKVNCEQINEWPLMESLTSIILLKNMSSKDIVSSIKACPNIQFFRIDKQLNDEDLAELAKLPRLKSFKYYSGREITDKGFEDLAKGCHELESLDLESSKVTGLSLIPYKNAFLKLKKINLDFTKLNDEGIIVLGRAAENLEEISFKSTLVTDEGFSKFLEICKKIKIIQLYSTYVTAKVFANWAKSGYQLPNVRKIEFSYQSSDEDIIDSAKALPNITYLGLSCARNITDRSLISLLNVYSKAKTIHMGFTNITGISLIGSKQVFQNIESLELRQTSLTDEGAIAFANICTNLKIINISRTNVTDTGVKKLLLINPNLKVDIGFPSIG